MNVLIIGGVAAGTKTAAKIKRELGDNCTVTLITKGKDISYAGCGLPYFVGNLIQSRDQLIVNSPENFSVLTGAEVHCETEAVALDVRKKTVIAKDLKTEKQKTFTYDKLVIAVGANPIHPPIAGIDIPGVYFMRTPDDAAALRDAVTSGMKRAVVCGGGFIGLEIAENLSSLGVKTVVVDMAPQIMPGFDADFAAYAERRLSDHDIPIFTSEKVTAIEGSGKVERLITENRKFKTDAVIMSVGIRPNTQFLLQCGFNMSTNGAIIVNDRMETNIEDIFAVGDCAVVKNRITETAAWSPMGSSANIEGRICAQVISGKNVSYPGVIGSAVVKLTGLNAGKTGMSQAGAVSAGLNAISATISIDDKAHYYPDADLFIIRLTADAVSHKLLGVQVLGKGAVDKVVDIAVCAISLGATLEELQDLDFCYAPPFSTAIHPFSHAVNVLINKLNGDMHGLTAFESEQTGKDFRMIDVMEFPTIPGCENIPYTSINGPIAQLEKDENILLICRKGKQAYFAQNRLKRYGYTNTYILEGGISFNEIEKKKNRS